MSLLQTIKHAWNSIASRDAPGENILSFFPSVSVDYGSDISEVTYFTCLKVLSESVAKLSLHIRDGDKKSVYNNDLYHVLNIKPNKFMTPYTFKMLMEYNRNHYGNAYAYMDFDVKGSLKQVLPLNPLYVTIWIDDSSLFTDRGYFYQHLDPRSGKSYILSPEQVIHLKGGIGKDGISGMCVREVLARNMQGNKAAQNFLNSLFQRGLTANAILKYTGDLNAKKRRELIDDLTSLTAYSSDRIIPIPLGMDLTPLDLKLTDSQFYELKKFSSLQIAAAFGITPNQLNNYEKSSYVNSEMQNLTFYTATLLPILTAWEEELNAKLLTNKQIKNGYRFKFNVSTILRGDLKSQTESLKNLVSGSIMTVNEARQKIDLQAIEGGDQLLVNGTYTNLQNVGNAYGNGGE